MGYQDIRGMINRYQEKNDQFNEISDRFQRNIKKYQQDIPIGQISVDSGQRVKNLKIAENSYASTEYNSRISRMSTGYQPECQGDLYTR